MQNDGEAKILNAKILNDWALHAGRSLQSKQTGWVHYYYGESKQPFDTVPLLENGLFILALFRSRLMEQVQEGKDLLSRLLHFQNFVEGESRGNFPVYLHEYPRCTDGAAGLQLLAPFYWILHSFSSVLGTALKDRLNESVRSILEYTLTEHQRKNFPYFFALRLAAAQAAFGKLWGKAEWENEGMEKLESLVQNQLEGWSTTKQLGEILVGLQMIYPSLANSPWNLLWKRMEETWHFSTGSYVGPSIREWQEGGEPMPNLYDLWGGYFSGQFSHRAKTISPFHLFGALIHPTIDRFSKLQSNIQKGHWKIVLHPDCCINLMEKTFPLAQSVEKTYTPFRLIWGDLNRVHSFICQGGTFKRAFFSDGEESVDLFFDLEDPTDEKKEVQFFLDYQTGIRFTLNGLAANTFELGEKLELNIPGRPLSLKFDLVEGEGQFLGHVMRGNRSSQINLKGENRFQSYDWTLFLRTIRRQGKCRLRASITYR